jgi:hypothetical protein
MMTGMPNGKFPLTSARRRALTVLASSPSGCTETVLTAHGVAWGFVLGLVRDGLASVHSESVMGPNRTLDIIRIKITDAGRQAIAQ